MSKDLRFRICFSTSKSGIQIKILIWTQPLMIYPLAGPIMTNDTLQNKESLRFYVTRGFHLDTYSGDTKYCCRSVNAKLIFAATERGKIQLSVHNNKSRVTTSMYVTLT